jgi:hypothetical protein
MRQIMTTAKVVSVAVLAFFFVVAGRSDAQEISPCAPATAFPVFWDRPAANDPDLIDCADPGDLADSSVCGDEEMPCAVPPVPFTLPPPEPLADPCYDPCPEIIGGDYAWPCLHDPIDAFPCSIDETARRGLWGCCVF